DRIVEEGDRTAVVGVGHVVTVRHGAGPVVLLPAAAHGHLVLVVARGQVEGAGVDTVLTERQRGRGAVRRPVAATAHGRVVAAGHGDELLGGLLRCRGAIERLAHRTESGGGDAVPGRIHGHGPVLHQGAGGQAGDVVEDPRLVPGGGAQRRPLL